MLRMDRDARFRVWMGHPESLADADAVRRFRADHEPASQDLGQGIRCHKVFCCGHWGEWKPFSGKWWELVVVSRRH